MTPEDKKRIAAEAAVSYVRPDTVVGVGTGSTVNHFIDLLAAEMASEVRAAVSSSEASSERLRGHGIPVVDLNEVGRLDIYVCCYSQNEKLSSYVYLLSRRALLCWFWRNPA